MAFNDTFLYDGLQKYLDTNALVVLNLVEMVHWQQ